MVEQTEYYILQEIRQGELAKLYLVRHIFGNHGIWLPSLQFRELLSNHARCLQSHSFSRLGFESAVQTLELIIKKE